MNLVGYIHPSFLDRTFAIPLYANEGQYFFHVLDDNSQFISKFELCKDEKPSYLKITTPVEVNTGSEAVFVFIDKGKPIFGNLENIIPLLKNIASEPDCSKYLKDEISQLIRLENKLFEKSFIVKKDRPDIFISSTAEEDHFISIEHIRSKIERLSTHSATYLGFSKYVDTRVNTWAKNGLHFAVVSNVPFDKKPLISHISKELKGKYYGGSLSLDTFLSKGTSMKRASSISNIFSSIMSLYETVLQSRESKEIAFFEHNIDEVLNVHLKAISDRGVLNDDDVRHYDLLVSQFNRGSYAPDLVLYIEFKNVDRIYRRQSFRRFSKLNNLGDINFVSNLYSQWGDIRRSDNVIVIEIDSDDWIDSNSSEPNPNDAMLKLLESRLKTK